MPVWHELTKPWVASGELMVLGITQEQHPERCRLFAQWHQIEWPILHDPINWTEATAVPLFVAIDEHGIVRSTRPRPDSFEADFLRRSFPKPQTSSSGRGRITTRPADLPHLAARAARENTAEAWRAYGDALLLWGPTPVADRVIEVYGRAATVANAAGTSTPGLAHFRNGVAYRLRYDTAERQQGDFQAAIDAWGKALEIDPNQYIWRRRIQQYGPRLEKPYPFYDWVAGAEEQIRARGEEPIELPVRPAGAELAQRIRSFDAAGREQESPDPRGRIRRDQQLIRQEVTLVPSRPRPGRTVRVHVNLTPQRDAHWNNEAGPAVVWIEAPNRFGIDRRRHELAQPKEVESNETRSVEFELKLPDDWKPTANDETRSISGYALYFVCEERSGQCLYLRRDFDIDLAR